MQPQEELFASVYRVGPETHVKTQSWISHTQTFPLVSGILYPVLSMRLVDLGPSAVRAPSLFRALFHFVRRPTHSEGQLTHELFCGSRDLFPHSLPYTNVRQRRLRIRNMGANTPTFPNNVLQLFL